MQWQCSSCGHHFYTLGKMTGIIVCVQQPSQYPFSLDSMDELTRLYVPVGTWNASIRHLAFQEVFQLQQPTVVSYYERLVVIRDILAPFTLNRVFTCSDGVMGG